MHNSNGSTYYEPDYEYGRKEGKTAEKNQLQPHILVSFIMHLEIATNCIFPPLHSISNHHHKGNNLELEPYNISLFFSCGLERIYYHICTKLEHLLDSFPCICTNSEFIVHMHLVTVKTLKPNL